MTVCWVDSGPFPGHLGVALAAVLATILQAKPWEVAIVTKSSVACPMFARIQAANHIYIYADWSKVWRDNDGLLV